MTIEKDVVVSLLRLTQNGSICTELLKKKARISADVIAQVLQKLSANDLIHLQRDMIEVSPDQRVKMTVHAVQLGADLEQVCKTLKWTEFESMAAHAFEANNFRVVRNFRFRRAHKRWEIDLLGCKQPFIASVDCKRWRHAWRKTAIIKTVEAQVERTRALANVLPLYCERIGLTEWKVATVIPMVLSLVPGPLKFYKDVPIVSILQLQDFINGMPGYVNLLTHFPQNLSKIGSNLIKFCQNNS